jgi:cytochrome c oxidase subunit 2
VFHYPEAGVTSTGELHLPLGRPAHLILTARESVHSFRVPELGGKWDLIPGRTNHVWVTPRETGAIFLPCPRTCAGKHPQMAIVVESAAEFADWISAGASTPHDSAGSTRSRARTRDPGGFQPS